jgi:DNA invertase Pin-like site-specific DNA recombinase
VSRRGALYVRVSTKEQTVENQERELRAWAGRLGLEVAAVYRETASGARADRAQLGELLAAAHRREFDTLLIWALDRLSREGIGALARYMEQLRTAGIRVLSHQEPWLDTAGPVSDLLVAVFGWVARQERQRLSERVRAGLARARERGTRSGRPIGRPRRILDLADVARRRAAGQTWRKVARALKVPARTLRDAVRLGRRAGENPQASFAPLDPSDSSGSAPSAPLAGS